MKPTIGRIVHFRARHENQVRAAIISNVHPKEGTELSEDDENAYLIDLHVFAPYGVDVAHRVEFSTTGQEPEHWFWPPRHHGGSP